MCRNAHNTGRIFIGAWLLIVALLPAVAYPADDGTATSPAATDPSTTSTPAPAPARLKIPPPRTWSQATVWPPEGQNRDSAPVSAPALPPVPVGDSAQAPTAAREEPATLPSLAELPALETPSKPTAAAAPQPVEPQSEGVSPQAAPAMTQAVAASVAATDATAAASAQPPAPPKPRSANLADTLGMPTQPEETQVDLLAMRSKADGQVTPVGCATCGGFHSLSDGSALHESLGCSGGNCIPGRQPCYVPNMPCNTVVGAFCQNLYQCLCCPDPCYQPQWVPAANASFFADYARPRTVTRLRYDNLESMTQPDRNQFWIQGVTAMRKNGHAVTKARARLQQFYLYQEAAGERGSFFIEYPYRQINQSWAPTQAGFSDLNFGIKSLMFDCELLQITFQFRTYTPTGNAMNNLGTGHFSLDPSILTTLKLGPTTYFQGQFGNWIPLAGNQSLAGGVFYSLMSLNQTLWYLTPDSPLIATLEMDAWSFENGGYTAAIKPGQTPAYVAKGGGVTYFNIGPGLRQSICNRLDFGAALTWATGQSHWAQPWFRFEARFLF